MGLGWPAEDLAGYVDGEAHEITLATDDWHLRDYQQQAVDGFPGRGSGSGPPLWVRQDARGRGGDG